jgi:hypothetical protein
MEVVLFVLGTLLLAIVIGDLLWTTLWVEGGAGPLTSLLMAWTWSGIRRVAGRNSRSLTLAGPVILVVGLVVWIVLLWGGWTFVFASGTHPLIDTVSKGPLSWYERVYFTGYTIFTLGIGDYVPRDGGWQIATSLATATGMLVITLTVTYVLSVLDAVTQKRSFANGVSGLGSRGEEIVRTSWDGEEFRGLDVPLSDLSSQLDTLTENHKAYPILHYFHSGQRDRAPVTSAAVLDDALTLFRFGVAESDRPSDTVVKNARSSVSSYLETLRHSFIEPADRSPPPPDLERLRAAGIPTVSDEAFDDAVEDLDERRQTLLALVESDARQWPAADDESAASARVRQER